jgi:hypothetical protein
MFKRSALLAIAATATLSLAALAPSSASAKFGGGGGGFGNHGGNGGHMGNGGHIGNGGHFGGGVRIGTGFKGGRTVRVLPSVRIVRWHHPHWRPQVIVRTGYVNTYAALRPVTSYAVSQPATCTCLTKEYLEDGSVLFKDTCTKEMVQNPPPADQTAQAPTQ